MRAPSASFYLLFLLRSNPHHELDQYFKLSLHNESKHSHFKPKRLRFDYSAGWFHTRTADYNLHRKYPPSNKIHHESNVFDYICLIMTEMSLCWWTAKGKNRELFTIKKNRPGFVSFSTAVRHLQTYKLEFQFCKWFSEMQWLNKTSVVKDKEPQFVGSVRLITCEKPVTEDDDNGAMRRQWKYVI